MTPQTRRSLWQHPKWLAAFAGVIAAVATLVAVIPFGEWLNTRAMLVLSAREQDLTQARLRQEQERNQGDYVRQTLLSETCIENKIALLSLLEMSYPEQPVALWSRLQIHRLDNSVAEDLLDVVARIQTAARARRSELNAELQEVLTSKNELEWAPEALAEDKCNISFRVFRPFRDQGLPSEYEEQESQAIIQTCDLKRPGGANRWTIWFRDKLLTCYCKDS